MASPRVFWLALVLAGTPRARSPMTAALAQPMDHDWGQIYLYIAGKTYTQWKKTKMPDDIRVESLNDDQTTDLNRLKEWLYRKRTTARQDKDRAERR